jgi:hypothetical protein
MVGNTGRQCQKTCSPEGARFGNAHALRLSAVSPLRNGPLQGSFRWGIKPRVNPGICLALHQSSSSSRSSSSSIRWWRTNRGRRRGRRRLGKTRELANRPRGRRRPRSGGGGEIGDDHEDRSIRGRRGNWLIVLVVVVVLDPVVAKKSRTTTTTTRDDGKRR